jgi:hypothetical protein
MLTVMKDFIQKVLTELNENKNIKSNSLVKMVSESVNKSILNKQSSEFIYKQLKVDLKSINEHLKNQTIDNLLSQFEKNETTTDSVIEEMTRLGDLKSQLSNIKESNAYSDPIISSAVNRYEVMLESQVEFKLYPSFINEFSRFSTEKSVNIAVGVISKVLESNDEDLEMLFNIYEMSGISSKLYTGVVSELKEMLINESYSSDIINLKFGKTNLPLITNLVNNLKILESKKDNKFTLGSGDTDNRIQNTIAPTLNLDKGNVISYIDDRFMRISESIDRKQGDTIHINEAGFVISTVNPNVVLKENKEFYSLCESFARLGFKQEGDMVTSSLIKNFKLGFSFNESNELDVYLNDNKVDSIDSINVTEALVMETSQIKHYVNNLLENTKDLVNLKFIKTISNDKAIAESTIFELNGNYFLCKKVNSAQREWSKVNEHDMFTYFKENYNYDISSIYSNAINETALKIKAIETRKGTILENVSKLETAVSEIATALGSPKLQKGAIPKLEKLKGSIESNISSLKEEYVSLDLAK